MDEVIAQRKKESFKIFDRIAHSYDLLNRILSMGIDIYWRNKLLKELPNQKGLKILDMATGTADVALTLSRSPLVDQIEGIDPSINMVAIGKQKVLKRNLQHKITLEVGNGEDIPRENDTYDVTTVSFGIRNYGDPQKGLREKLRVLKKGGRSLVLEFSIPDVLGLKQLYLFYFRNILPFIGNLISRHDDAYTYLNKTAEDFPSGEAFMKWMRQAGFTNVRAKKLTFGVATIYIGEKPNGN
jgi:demethylmenaquinone methyltransferase/2-methoxy-6-polyprenyl-1,4-benzoquinol methylase